ncbi:MAG: sulfotransferase, partial [Deltaproteobacteria bacterium]|nr:sulfotransferase [Deltaproteobacteria bacterium]
MMNGDYGDPEEGERIGAFRKDEEEELFLNALNNHLILFEKEIVKVAEAPEYPVTFIVGVPRCGSTLLMQLAVSTYELGYPSNLMARFFKAPAVGAWLQRLIIRQRDGKRVGYESTFGVTSSPEEPHEFGYFWTSFFKPELTHWFEPEVLKKVDKKNLLKELAAIESILKHPLIFKSVNLDFLIEYLLNGLPLAFFIYLNRDPYFLAESIYLARIARYGDPKTWWSLRPKHYVLLKTLDHYHQVAGQVWAVKAELERQLKKVPEDQKIVYAYRDLCQDPGKVLEAYAGKMKALGSSLKRLSDPPLRLECRDKVKLGAQESRKLRTALEEMEDF